LEDSSNFQEIVYDPPEYNINTNYFGLYWQSFVDNERILNQIQDVNNENV